MQPPLLLFCIPEATIIFTVAVRGLPAARSSDGGERQGEPNAETGLFPREVFCSDPNSWCDPVQKPPSLATWDTVTRELREVSQKWNSVPLGVQENDCFFGRELQKR